MQQNTLVRTHLNIFKVREKTRFQGRLHVSLLSRALKALTRACASGSGIKNRGTWFLSSEYDADH